MGLNSYRSVLLGVAFAVLLAVAAVTPSITTGAAYAATTNTLTVNAYSSDGKPLGMWATIKSGTTTIKSGFTPMTMTGTTGATYVVTVSDYAQYVFDHWGNGSTGNPRWVTLNGDTTATAYYKTSTTSSTTTTPPTTSTSPTSIQSMIPKTGILVSLYMYPGSTGSAYWQMVINEKLKHPSVPVVAIFNPSSGPGSYKDSNIASWVAKLKSAGVIPIGYVADDYGTKSLTTLKSYADKYKNWYNANGLFIDEFTNKVGYETHYRDLTTYAKSIGMKLIIGNPGTDVPKSYIGTVDVLNITEGVGYMPISWLQYCVNCSSSTEWHYQYDRRNFSYIRYAISSLDTSFETESAQRVGLLYIHSGSDSNGRWFSLPSYFSTEVATLDR